MKLNCKPGDLAIIVSADHERNIGQIVEVIETHDGRTPFQLPWNGHVWLARTVSGRRTLSYYFTAKGCFMSHARGPVPDARLRPITGLPDHEGLREDIGQPVLALVAEHKHRGLAEVVAAPVDGSGT